MSDRTRTAVVSFLISAGLAVLAMGVAVGFVVASGQSATAAIETYFRGAFGSPSQLAATLSHAIPLFLVAQAWIIVYKSGRFQIGFPGQITIGGIAAATVALKVQLPGGVVLLLAVV